MLDDAFKHWPENPGWGAMERRIKSSPIGPYEQFFLRLGATWTKIHDVEEGTRLWEREHGIIVSDASELPPHR
jgi:hypothetical protein